MNIIYIALVAIAGFLAWMFSKNAKKEKEINRAKIPQLVQQWEPEITSAAREFNVPKSIAYSVLWVESGGRPEAVGSAGEQGLMQLKDIATKDLKMFGYGTFPGYKTKPDQNIRAGVAYLALQYKRTGNWYEAVKAYNQGYEGKERNPQKAQNYLNKVKEKEKFFA